MTNPIGEIVQSSITEFAAQTLRFGESPPFGSFVKVVDGPGTVYGVVYAVESGSLDPGGRPIVRGRDGLRDQAIYEENPDLELVLRTELRALSMAHDVNGTLRVAAPPHPPRLHWSVYACDAAETVRVTESLEYLRVLLAAQDAPVDSLLTASIRAACAARDGDLDFARRAARDLAVLMKRDYQRLTAIARALVD
ncbi:MAG: hypothetical protein U0821_19935 [Chloroflexota bacterium]